MLLLAVLISHYTFFVVYGAVVAAIGSAGGFRQQRPRWGILPIRQFAVGSLWLSPASAGRADVMFGHWFPPHIRFPMLIFERSWLCGTLHYDVFDQLCCTCNIMMILADIGCVVLVTLLTCFFTNSNANIVNICGACNSNDGFREQRPRWGIFPIRQFAHACHCWYSWLYFAHLGCSYSYVLIQLKITY